MIVRARGPWGPQGPSYRIHVESVTTYCQAGNLLSGRLSAAVRDAPNNRIHAPKSFRILCTQQPHTLHTTTAYMHPTASAYMHPKGADFALKSSRIHAPRVEFC